MDPVTLTTLIAVGASVLVHLIGTVVARKWFPAAPAAPDPASPVHTGHPVLDMIAQTITEILKTHATSAIKGGIGTMVAPALLQAAKQFLASLETSAAAPAAKPA